MIRLFDEIPYIEYGDIILSRVVSSDVPGLVELTSDDMVYKYLPTFLFEKQFSDMNEVVSGIYRDIFESKESLILGIHRKGSDELAGLAEFYGFKDSIHKISIGYRLSQRFWRKHIATSVVAAMVDYLYSKTDIEIITASTMVENRASARVLEKNGFDLVVSGADEDWGFEEPVKADKWIR